MLYGITALLSLKLELSARNVRAACAGQGIALMITSPTRAFVHR